ncbi:diaminobutyrate acetyltransferase [Limimonas halophila]|nr:diaminobutyrate acetyltransferase [Limimonas halophila]
MTPENLQNRVQADALHPAARADVQDAGGTATASTPANPRKDAKRYRFRAPETGDGAAIYKIVEDSGVLDLNSAYSYLMLGEYLADTCLVAERKGGIVGFVSGLVPRTKPETLFIWQVASAESERGRGLAKRLVHAMLSRPACRHVRYIEATVTPSNKPSKRLFRALARDLDAGFTIGQGFDADLFPGEGHESERLIRVGPFQPAASA